MCILMLLRAPAVAVLPHSRSGQWKRAGLLVAVRVVPAELRGENRHSGNIFVSYGVRVFTCFYSLFLDYLFRGETWRLMFLIARERNLMPEY